MFFALEQYPAGEDPSAEGQPQVIIQYERYPRYRSWHK